MGATTLFVIIPDFFKVPRTFLFHWVTAISLLRSQAVVGQCQSEILKV